jgi:hypothetical protein
MITARSATLFAATILFISIVTGSLLIVGEMAFRAIDGYQLLSWELVPAGTAVQNKGPEKAARAYARSIPLAEGMKAEWFDSSPVLVRGETSAVLSEAARRFGEAGVEDVVRIFNWNYIRPMLCTQQPFSKFPGFAFVYDAPDGADRPRYRFPRNAVARDGLVTNNFGWRGPPIDLRKPEKTVRLAFIGSSTTINAHAFPFSYPELVNFWLNTWAKQTGLDVNIETVNAGREGVDSEDITTIFQNEVASLEPDIVVWDGATQKFTPSEFVKRVPSGQAEAVPPAPKIWLEDHSAIARRLISGLVEGKEEPQKPAYEVRWPADLDENDPPLAYPHLPNDISNLVKGLDQVRGSLEHNGGELMLSSFFLFAFDGMKLNPQSGIYDYLNRIFYPYRYADFARMAAFQNRVLQKYAQAHALQFLNFAQKIPHDPQLYGDGVHAVYDGVRLQAWIVAQQLAPLIQLRLSQKRLPRAMQSGVSQHPAFPGNERTIAFDCSQKITTEDRLEKTGDRLEELKLSDVQAIEPAAASFGETLKVQIEANAADNRYMVTVPTAGRAYPDRDFVLVIELLVSSGNINVGVLSVDQKRFLGSLLGVAPRLRTKLLIPFFSSDGKIGPVAITKGSGSDQATAAEIISMSIWSRSANEGFIKEYVGLTVPPARGNEQK